ncbi:baseplate J/gp47 family protein [Streptomyces sp. NRRL S-350]|uniref:baseplate J/gp47 family protein n=1 Tax=Streptomyces sp. NRRL S-350 TaxID=1463902 RepID=UPI0004BFF0FE|nr:baseplate J/gp47 family protein [Streptomyces sp. NRRL S-350]
MTDYGVTEEGFVLKPFDVLLREAVERVRAVLGVDLSGRDGKGGDDGQIDLTSTSPVRKLLEVAAHEDAELWKRMEDLYYANFVSTAFGDALDLLGDDVGLARRNLFSTGTVRFTLAGAALGRIYTVPEGTIVTTTDSPPKAFATTAAARLSAAAGTADVGVVAVGRGHDQDVGKDLITVVDPAWQAVYLADFAPATLTVTNPDVTTGGLDTESDQDYRARLSGLARSIWTLDSVRQAVLDVDGVIDVATSDPLGGVDVSQSYFGQFDFDQRLFNSERHIGEPYFFDVLVAHDFRWPWRTPAPVPGQAAPSVTGVYERVSAAVDRVRPVGVHANIVEADHIDVGVRARVTVETGYDTAALRAAILQRLAIETGGPRLGGVIRYSQVMCAFAEQSGVVDVQQLHLRRLPPAFGRITFGAVPQQSGVVEAAVGENLVMGPTEMAVFRPDGLLVDVTVVVR